MKKAVSVFLMCCAFAAGVAQAKDIFIAKNVAGVRAQPNSKSETKWELVRGYPLEIIKKKGQWAHVKDFEGPLGWVYIPHTNKSPHHIVKVKVANLRSGPGTKFKKVGQVEQYAILKTLGKDQDWVKVRTTAGKTGWVQGKLVWGK